MRNLIEKAIVRASSQRSITRHIQLGLFLIIALLGTLSAWAVTTKITGAVIAQGLMVVSSDTKKIQHPAGGVVKEILVRNGSKVGAGEILLTLDETVLNANLALVTKGLTELTIHRTRLLAERDGVDRFEFPSSKELALDIAQQAFRDEKALFERRRSARASVKNQLRQRIKQSTDERIGLSAQLDAKAQEIELVQAELTGAATLWNKALIPITKYNALRREAARLGGERGQLIANIALADGKITETGLRILQIDEDLGSEVGKELREIDYRINDLVERRVAAQDQLHRTEIVAPQAGIVHELAVHTIGAVIRPGDAIMLIVPQREALMAEVRIQPQDVDQLREGQDALLRFSAFSQSTTPDCRGTVSHISADLASDPRNGATFYLARIGRVDLAPACLGTLTLLPGMPVEAFFRTGDRTVWSYLTKPLADQMARAFRAD